MFQITLSKGFYLTFSNGITISTQIGGGNYCDNYDFPIGSKEYPPSCKDAEIAIWDKDGVWITDELLSEIKMGQGESVAGRILFEDWLKITDYIRNLKKKDIDKLVKKAKDD